MSGRRPQYDLAFEFWYLDERRSVRKTADKFRVSERAVNAWMLKYSWKAKAAERDREADRRAYKEAVARRARMLNRHAGLGRSMQVKGYKYLDERDLDNAAQAITAMTKGIEIERQAEGLPAWIVELMGMDDDDLIAEYQRLTQVESGASGDEEAGI